MSHSHPKQHIPYCLNCHYPLAEFDSFCPNCGQKPTDGKITIHDLLHEFTHTLFHVDGKLFTTLKHIFIPGKLTLEFFRGHHKRYAHPVQLFLVLGATFLFMLSFFTHNLEEGVKKKIENSKHKNEKMRLIAELDSSARQMKTYKKDAALRQTFDSVLMKKYVEINTENESTAEIQIRAFENRKNIVKKQLIIAQLQNKADSLQKIYPNAFKLRMSQLAIELKELKSDSVAIVEKFAKTEKISNDSAKIRLKNFIFGRAVNKNVKILVNGKPIFEQSNISEALLIQKLDSQAQQQIPSMVEDEMDDLPSLDTNPSTVFWEDVKEGLNQTDGQKKSQKTKKLKPFEAVNADSISNFGVTLAINDIQDLEVDKIFEKYHVEGFWKRRTVAATAMSMKSGQDKIHAFFSKLLWIIIFSLLPTAGWLWLLYWRQKRYFVEHLVWLLHVYCLVFLLFPLVFLDNLWGIPIFGMLCLVAPFFALKNYYKQSWRKTFLKYVLFTTGYYVIASVAFIVGIALSFLFF